MKGGDQARTVVLSRFRLDGGAMFGTVPRAVWERVSPADARHRIELAARVLWLRSAEHDVLIDAGTGTAYSAREHELYALRPTLPADWPFRWESLTHIVSTHLHFDHAGGLVTPAGDPAAAAERDAPPATRLTAPQAEIILQRANWDRARAPGPRERGSYLPRVVEPVAAATLRLVDGAQEVLPGVRVHRSDGHTCGMQWVTAETARGTIAFPADLVPTASHLHVPWVMGYDVWVERLVEEKDAFLQSAVEQGWIVVFAHDPSVAAARLERDARGRYAIAETVEI